MASEHEFLKQLIKDLKIDLNLKIDNFIKEIKENNEVNRLSIKELYEERNKLKEKDIIFASKQEELIKDINNLGEKTKDNCDSIDRLSTEIQTVKVQQATVKMQLAIVKWAGSAIGLAVIGYILREIFKIFNR